MLSKKHRLPIPSVMKKSGQNIRGRYFLLKAFPSGLDFNRFGVIISKKVSSKATDRNRVKRAIFNNVREFLSAGKEKKDFLFIISPRIMEAKPEEIKEEVRKFLSF